MIKRLLCVMAVIVSTWMTSVRLVQASCSDSSVLAVASPIISRAAMAAVWRIEPACDVIESGLLVGTDPGQLTPVGQPIYGYREIYQQDISVAQDGAYWVAAYARDEETLPSHRLGRFSLWFYLPSHRLPGAPMALRPHTRARTMTFSSSLASLTFRA